VGLAEEEGIPSNHMNDPNYFASLTALHLAEVLGEEVLSRRGAGGPSAWEEGEVLT
jgi:hypothetical protein